MQSIIESGIAIIVAIQSMGAWLAVPMEFFSNLGTEDFFFIVLPLIYWSINSALGIRVGFILVTSSTLNYIGKLLFAGPRPYWASSQVKGLWPEITFGAPSGHAQKHLPARCWVSCASRERSISTLLRESTCRVFPSTPEK